MHVFVDEYGDTKADTSKGGTSKFFILAAVVVPDGEVASARAGAEVLRKKFFQTGEMKSSNVGRDDTRRLRILQEVKELPVSVFALAVDKREIIQDSGLGFKRSFFKYINARLYEWLYRHFERVSVIADEHGGADFMEEVRRYLEKKFQPGLFARRTFDFVPSQTEPLVQVADLVAGSLARAFDPEKLSPQSTEILQEVADVSIDIEIWPPRLTPRPQKTTAPQASPSDETVRRHCLRQAALFLEQHSSEDDNADREARAVLQYILFQTNALEREFVHGGEIRGHLARMGLALDERQFQAAVARLRDQNVILASGAQGYRVPTRAADLQPFLDHAHSIVVPMLARVKRARDELHAASFGNIDILDDWDVLRELLERLDAARVS